MEALSSIYDRAFFAPYSPQSTAYARACGLIGRELARRYAPHSAVDWGCGTGLHLAALHESGTRVLGIDGADVPADLRAPGVDMVRADLTRPTALPPAWERHDLSLCIDVLEHIDDAHADAALDNVTRGADMVILSCAPPHQGGHHHVNEQPRRYWIAKMAARGWEYQQAETGDLEGAFLATREQFADTWMFHNLCVYLPSVGKRLGRRGRRRRRRQREAAEAGR